MTRLMMTLAAALAATLMAAPVWADPGQARIWIEYKGPQVLDACDPGMPSTETAVNVEANGGFFDAGQMADARVSFSPSDVLEYGIGSEPNSPIPSNGVKLNLKKGDNIIRFRQKASAYAPMPTSERRVVRISLQTSCSDCRGAPGGTPVMSNRILFSIPPGWTIGEGKTTCSSEGCCRNNFDSPSHGSSRFRVAKNNGLTADDVTERFSHVEIPNMGCRVRVQPPGAATYTWQACNTTKADNYCYAVPNRVSDPACDFQPVYQCQWDIRHRHQGSEVSNDSFYRFRTTGTVFSVQWNGYGCD